jgi:hypothetical protein
VIDRLPKCLVFHPQLSSSLGLPRRCGQRVGQTAFFRANLAVVAPGQAVPCLRSPAAVSVGPPVHRFRRHNHRRNEASCSPAHP